MPDKEYKHIDGFLDESEIITRINHVIYLFKEWDIASLDFKKSWEQNQFDDYTKEAVLTSIEHEFHIVFEDHLYESFENLDQVKRYLLTDHNAF